MLNITEDKLEGLREKYNMLHILFNTINNKEQAAKEIDKAHDVLFKEVDNTPPDPIAARLTAWTGTNGYFMDYKWTYDELHTFNEFEKMLSNG